MVNGFGIGLRIEFLDALLETERSIDWLEIVAENWIGLGGTRRRQLDRCAERWPIVPHSVTMSIGGTAPLDETFFREATRLCKDVRAPFWSDHLAHAVHHGTYVNDLFPLPFSDEALAHVLARIAKARTLTDVPLAFENPTYYVPMPGRTMPESTFLREIVRGSGCGMLLDVNNVYVNARNHGFDPEAFIRELPLDRVVQIHVAGHSPTPDVILDTHVGPVCDGVWSLYRHTLRTAGRMIPTLVEWDSEIPGLDAVVDELERARAEAAAALPSTTEAA